MKKNGDTSAPGALRLRLRSLQLWRRLRAYTRHSTSPFRIAVSSPRKRVTNSCKRIRKTIAQTFLHSKLVRMWHAMPTIDYGPLLKYGKLQVIQAHCGTARPACCAANLAKVRLRSIRIGTGVIFAILGHSRIFDRSEQDEIHASSPKFVATYCSLPAQLLRLLPVTRTGGLSETDITGDATARSHAKQSI